MWREDANMNFNKIKVIIRHEFMTRIRSKAFIIATLLAPLGLIAIIAIPIIATTLSEDVAKTVAVVDPSHRIAPLLVKEDSSMFFASNSTEANLAEDIRQKRINGYLLVPEHIGGNDTVQLFSSGGGGLMFHGKVEDAVQRVIRHERMVLAGADTTIMSVMKKSVPYATKKLSEKGVEKDSGDLLALIGYALGFFIYMMMFIYGGMVMRAVLEEKTNRIVEVIASSAKPFEIMLGKILGVGGMGLVQIAIWISMSMLVTTFAAPIVTHLLGASSSDSAMKMLQANDQQGLSMVFKMPNISPWIPIGFIFYFISGYFMYASLFAAVAAAADQEQDMQSLQMPITLPLIIPMLFIGNVISAPDGTLATVLSMIPFFTPVLMIVRVAATHVPVWQIIVSTLLVIGTFIGTVWAAGRIYRVGILSYGKKASFKDMARWLLHS